MVYRHLTDDYRATLVAALVRYQPTTEIEQRRVDDLLNVLRYSPLSIRIG